MPRLKEPKLNAVQAMQKAREYVLGRMQTVPFPLPKDEDEAKRTMDALVEWCIQAWGDGFYTGRER